MALLPIDYTEKDAQYISGTDRIDESVKAPNAVTDGTHVYITIDGLKPYLLPTVSALVPPVDTCYGLLFYASVTWFWASVTKIYLVNTTGAATDITRTVGGNYANQDGSGNPYLWRPEVFGGVFLLVPYANDPPQYYDTATAKMADMPSWPAGYTCQFMVAYKNYICAYNIHDGTTRYASRVMWGSSVDDAGNLPGSWSALPTNDAGQRDLLETRKDIITAKQLVDTVYIFKSSSIYKQVWVGGQEIFKFTLFSPSIGCAATLGVANFSTNKGDMQFFIGNTSIYIHNGASIMDIAYGRIQKEFFANNSTSIAGAHSYALHHRKEIWTIMPQSAGGSKIYIWNWEEDKWYPTITDSTKFMTGGLGDFAGFFYDKLLLTKYAATSNQTYQTDADITTSRTFTITRTGLSLPIPLPDGKTAVNDNLLKNITRIWPKIYAPSGGTFKIYVGVQYTLGGAITWGSVISLTIGGVSDYTPFIDIDPITTRYGAFKIEFATADMAGLWKMTGMDIEYDIIGEASQ